MFSAHSLSISSQQTQNINYHFKVIHVGALINNSHNKPTNAPLLELYFLYTICHNFNLFHSTLIIFRKLLNINNDIDKIINYIKTCA
jgi:hypothetical protein